MNIRGVTLPYVVSTRRWTSFSPYRVELFRTEQEALKMAKSHIQQPNVDTVDVWLHTPDSFNNLELLWTMKNGRAKLVRPSQWEIKR